MTTKTAKDHRTPLPGEALTFRHHLSEVFGEQRRKGLFFRGFWRQQKEMAVSPRQAQFFQDAAQTLRGVRDLHKRTRRVESFETAVARQGLTDEFLSSKMQRYKWMHLALYMASGVTALFALWLFQKDTAFLAFGVLIASFGIAVNGYIQGFRAWQIEHRNLIRFQDALRIPGTYLVL